MLNYLFEGGYNFVLCARSGKDCVKLAKNEKPALIIMSWEKGGHDGLVTLQEIKKGKATRDIPVIMYTGSKTKNTDLKKALGAGVLQFICEPFDKQEFLFRVNTVIELSKLIRQEDTSDELERLRSENENLKSDIKNFSREVNLSSLRESHWNDFMLWLLNRLHHLSISTDIPAEKIKPSINRIINDCNTKKNRGLWKELKMRIVENHHDSFQHLLHDFPSLTVNDLRILAFIRLNLTTKEIASITFKPVNTIKATRKRIRKKLKISDRKQSLVAFLAQY